MKERASEKLLFLLIHFFLGEMELTLMFKFQKLMHKLLREKALHKMSAPGSEAIIVHCS